jgi:NitT/TauT family transport system substrate-binding protein
MDSRSGPIDEFHTPLNRRQPLSRRDFLRIAASAGAVGAGAVLLGGCGSGDGNGSATSTPGVVVDPPPETTTIRLPKNTLNPRLAPFFLADQFLPAEGFTDVQYIDVPEFSDGFEQLIAGEVDIGVAYTSSVLVAAERDDQLVMLAGVQVSPFVLFGNDRVQSLRDLKGKRIFVFRRDATDSIYALWAVLLAYVGIDLEREVEFVELAVDDVFPQIAAGTIDAWLSAGPYTTIFQDATSGHIFLDALMDPPWSQYFGRVATGNRDFVEKNPAAAKRALRAILKGTDMCAREPEGAARYLVDRGFSTWDYDLTLDGISAQSYAAWREFNPEDTVRFYALRLREAGLVTSTPDELIARATDWRYLNEIKRELGVA